MTISKSGINQQHVVYSPEIFCWQRYGGISRYFYELILEIKSAGWQVEIDAGLHSNAYLDQLRSSTLVHGRELYDSDLFSKLGRTFLLLANSLAFNLNNTYPGIVHQTYYSPFARRNGRLVVTVHDLIHEKLGIIKQGAGSKIARRTSIAAAEKVIAISESTRNDLLDYYDISPDRIEVIHHGVRFNEIPLQESGNKNNNPPYLLYVGMRGGYKNFNRFIKAFAESIQLRSMFKIVCFGGGSFTSEELSLFSKHKIGDHIEWLEGDDVLLAKFYMNAVMLVYPSLYEGFGLPVLEAMAHRCPVACSNTSSLPEVGGDAVSYFSPDDLDSIREAIERAVSDTHRLREKIQDGYQRAKSFSWQETARKTINVYSQVLEGSK